jgi:ribosomal 50S subunit-associated protein YjgA (DUF615 family)
VNTKQQLRAIKRDVVRVSKIASATKDEQVRAACDALIEAMNTAQQRIVADEIERLRASLLGEGDTATAVPAAAPAKKSRKGK